MIPVNGYKVTQLHYWKKRAFAYPLGDAASGNRRGQRVLESVKIQEVFQVCPYQAFPEEPCRRRLSKRFLGNR